MDSGVATDCCSPGGVRYDRLPDRRPVPAALRALPKKRPNEPLREEGGHGAKESFEAAERLLAAGWHVLLFPEGTRSVTGEIGTFRPGVGLLAAHSGCNVLPVRIVGTADVLPKGSSRPHRARVEVRFGAPLRIEPDEDPRTFTARLEAVVRAM